MRRAIELDDVGATSGRSGRLAGVVQQGVWAMGDELPEWLSTEHNVRTLFTAFGFDVTKCHVTGRQIDLIASRGDALLPRPETFVVEITTSLVDATKGAVDGQKLRTAATAIGPHTRKMLVSTTGFAGPQRNSLVDDDIVPLTYAELEARLINLDKYVASQRLALRSPPEGDVGFNIQTFVEPRVQVHRTFGEAHPTEMADATKWLKAVLTNKSGVVGALLGNLGSGKTTILQKVQLDLLDEVLTNPSASPIPVYIPLSRFRQHSGRVTSLLQEVFAEAGIENYPSKLVQFLCRVGRIVLLFDGLDEVHPILSTEDILRTVTAILDYLGKESRAVIASRTHLFANANEEFAVFGPYERQKLTATSAKLRSLLDNRPSSEIAYVQPFEWAQVQAYLQKACGTTSESVKGYIDTTYGLRDMAKTPVLLAMMTSTLPELVKDQHVFGPFPVLDLYAGYTDRWIRRDLQRAQLTPDIRLALSRRMATMLGRKDEFAATWAEIIDILRSDPAWTNFGISDTAAEYDIRNSTFLVREGENVFRFVHRSILEYFAAQESLEKLQVTGIPDPPISDGHAEFVAQLLAASWIQSERVTLVKSDLNITVPTDRAIIASVEAASRRLAGIPTGYSFSYPTITGLQITGDGRDRIEFHRLRLDHCNIAISGNISLALREVALTNSVLKAEGRCDVVFESPSLSGSKLLLSADVWTTMRYEPIVNVPPVVTQVPPAFQHATQAIDLGAATVQIGSDVVTVGFTTLSNACSVLFRVAGRKVDKEALTTGKLGDIFTPRRSALEGALLGLDTSRSQHQFFLTPDGMRVATALKTSPLTVQAEIALFK